MEALKKPYFEYIEGSTISKNAVINLHNGNNFIYIVRGFNIEAENGANYPDIKIKFDLVDESRSYLKPLEFAPISSIKPPKTYKFGESPYYPSLKLDCELQPNGTLIAFLVGTIDFNYRFVWFIDRLTKKGGF